MKPFDLIIFDFDGTLAESGYWFRHALKEIAIKHNFNQLNDEELELLRGYSNRKILQEMNIPLWKIPFIARTFKKQFAKDVNQIKLYDEIHELLKELSEEGIILTVVSSNSLENVKMILGEENCNYITHFSCGASLFGKKRIFKKILNNFKMSPQRVLSIGDEGRDIEAGKLAGVVTGAVIWGYANEELLSSMKPDFLFKNIQEIKVTVLG